MSHRKSCSGNANQLFKAITQLILSPQVYSHHAFQSFLLHDFCWKGFSPFTTGQMLLTSQDLLQISLLPWHYPRCRILLFNTLIALSSYLLMCLLFSNVQSSWRPSHHFICLTYRILVKQIDEYWVSWF